VRPPKEGKRGASRPTETLKVRVESESEGKGCPSVHYDDVEQNFLTLWLFATL
jgi:hypothetical protein